jgi:hypothetical protein
MKAAIRLMQLSELRPAHEFQVTGPIDVIFYVGTQLRRDFEMKG